MHVISATSDRIVLGDGEHALVEYVLTSAVAARESPRPYLLLRSRRGVPLTGMRPADHVWHHGLSLALPNVGEHNFWGGPTYVAGEGYVALDNNGRQIASDVSIDAGHDGVVRVDHNVDWISAAGTRVLSERRTLTARLVDEDSWALTWHSTVRNVTDHALAFGSPTSRGRPDAGYAGVFWRGPEAFTGSTIIGERGVIGEAARGAAAPWLAIVAEHLDAGVAMFDAPERTGAWFARAEEYAGMGPAPFFFNDRAVAPGDDVDLDAALLIGRSDVDSLAHSLAPTMRTWLVEAATTR